MDVAGSQSDGAGVQQWTCDGTDDQEFQVIDVGDGWHNIKFRHSGKCLDVYGGSTADGARVIQWWCHGGDNQKFRVPNTSGAVDRLVANTAISA